MISLKQGTGHLKPGKSWNSRISFSSLPKSWNLVVGQEKLWKIVVKTGNRLSLQMSEQKQNKTKASYQAMLSRQLELHAFWPLPEISEIRDQIPDNLGTKFLSTSYSNIWWIPS